MTNNIKEIPQLLSQFKHTYTGSVKFHEVDAFKVVHNLKYLEWTEIARVEYCRHLGISILPDKNSVNPPFSIYLVHSEVNYFCPATFFDEYIIYSRVSKIGKSSVTFEHIVTKSNGTPLCMNKVVEVYVNKEFKPTDIEDSIRKIIFDFEGII